MIPNNVKERFINLLPEIFFNQEIPESYKALSGLSKKIDSTITKMVEDIEQAFEDFTNSCSVKNVIVNGGGGAPGSWSNGIGLGGGIEFEMDLKLTDLYDYNMHKKKNRIFEDNFNTVVTEAFNALTFTGLNFGAGSSTHTAQSPGKLNPTLSINSKVNQVAQVIGLDNIIDSFSPMVKNDLESDNFILRNPIRGEVDAFKDLILELIEYWLNNTTLTNVTASGGVTSPAAGVLAGGAASGGNFN